MVSAVTVLVDGREMPLTRRRQKLILEIVSTESLHIDDLVYGALVFNFGPGQIRVKTEVHHPPIKEDE